LTFTSEFSQLVEVNMLCSHFRCRGAYDMNQDINIQHDPYDKQFFITIDGTRAYLAYMDLGKKTLDIYRTFVPNGLRGKGLAAKLTEHALQFAHDKGYVVIPSCSYVERYMQRQKKLGTRQP
jgi:predicted GNAT family acetyltransferase